MPAAGIWRSNMQREHGTSEPASPEEQIREAIHSANVRGDRNEAAKCRLRLADLDRGRLVSMGGGESVRGQE